MNSRADVFPWNVMVDRISGFWDRMMDGGSLKELENKGNIFIWEVHQGGRRNTPPAGGMAGHFSQTGHAPFRTVPARGTAGARHWDDARHGGAQAEEKREREGRQRSRRGGAGMRIVQIVDGCKKGDGVGNVVAALDAFLRRNGHDALVWAKRLNQEDIDSETFGEGTVAFCHLSLRADPLVRRLKCGKVLVFHNITEPELLEGAGGRVQLYAAAGWYDVSRTREYFDAAVVFFGIQPEMPGGHGVEEGGRLRGPHMGPPGPFPHGAVPGGCPADAAARRRTSSSPGGSTRTRGRRTS